MPAPYAYITREICSSVIVTCNSTITDEMGVPVLCEAVLTRAPLTDWVLLTVDVPADYAIIAAAVPISLRYTFLLISRMFSGI